MIHSDQAFGQSMDAVRHTLLRAPMVVREVSEHLAVSLGKGIRVRLLLACSMDGDGMVNPSAIRAAAAVELLHMATLVHDDIIDNAVLRRGLPALHSKFGNEKAVLGGDWLLCAAIKLALDVKIPGDAERKSALARAFVVGAERLCLGELDERANLGDVALEPRIYLRIIDRKTAALFCLAAHAGALVADLPAREIALLIRFARYFGHIFQISDDIKDYCQDEATALKSVQNDLFSGVITLPAILAFAKDATLRPLAKEIITGGGALSFIERIKKSGGVDDAHTICKRYTDKARAAAAALGHRRQHLEALLSAIAPPPH